MLRRFWLAIVFAALARGETQLGDFRWPPVVGELSGVTRLAVLGDALPVTWRVRTQPGRDGTPQLELDFSANGLTFHVTGSPPSGESAGKWKLIDGTVNLATWKPVAIAHLDVAGLAPDLVMAGTLTLSGSGTWREGSVSGQLSATVAGASASSEQQKWSASGLSLSVEALLEKNVPTVRTANIAIDALSVAGLISRRIVAEAAGIAGGRVEVRRVNLDMLGGRIALTPFTLDPVNPSIDTTADLAGIALGDLAALMPQALTAATGQIAGRIAVKWNVSVGVEPGTGGLTVPKSTPATVSLAARPGFLTDRIPARFNLLGTSLGPLSKLASLENPAYDTLRRVELGELPLVVDNLEVKLYPDGPSGASARIELSGHPAEAKSVVGGVSFSVNVDGPLSQVLKLGMQKNASMSIGAGK